VLLHQDDQCENDSFDNHVIEHLPLQEAVAVGDNDAEEEIDDIE
jgi:hypothetical protein